MQAGSRIAQPVEPTQHLVQFYAGPGAWARSVARYLGEGRRSGEAAPVIATGEPDWEQFQQALNAEIDRVLAFSVSGGLRAYGEMVGVVWSAGKRGAAIRSVSRSVRRL